MSIKTFKGIGFFNVETSTTTVDGVPVPGGDSTIISVDQNARAAQGSLGDPTSAGKFYQYEPPDPDVGPEIVVTGRPPGPIGPIIKNLDPAPPSPISYTPDTDPQVFSKRSQLIPYETLFHQFDLGVYPFYNFWTSDELTNDREDRGKRKLEDIPRYIKISWTPAPDLSGGRRRREPTNKVARPTKQVSFGGEIEKPKTYAIKGIQFLPDHLQAKNFTQIVNALSNGHLAPGVVEAIVELPLKNSGLEAAVKVDKMHQIDEDAFLSHPDTAGMSIHELKAQAHQLTNGILGSRVVSDRVTSDSISSDKESFFDGKFSVARSPRPGDMMQIQSVHPSSPALSIAARTAQGSEPQIEDPVQDLISKVSRPANVLGDVESAFTKVRFVNPAIGGAISEKKIDRMSKPEHVESVVALSHVLPNLEVLSQSGLLSQERHVSIPNFSSPEGLRSVEYVGYVLEKYRRNKTGVFEKIDQIELPDREYSEYIDTRVLYGEIYRYRIRSIFRWTRPANVGPLGEDDSIVPQNGSQTSPTAPLISSYFASEWNFKWAYGACIDDQPPPSPDELTVRPESAFPRVCVTFRLPYNPQKDIFKMVLFRKTQDESGADLTNWERVQEFGSVDRGVDFGPQNVLYYDNDVTFFQDSKTRYVYSAQTISRHGEYSTLSEQLSCRLNKEFKYLGEYLVDFVSCAGVRPEYFGSFSVYPPRTARNELVLHPRAPSSPIGISISGRNSLGNILMDDAKYFARIESLDTGEKTDVPINVKYNVMKERVNSSSPGIYVSRHSLGRQIEQSQRTDVKKKPLPAPATTPELTVRPGRDRRK